MRNGNEIVNPCIADADCPAVKPSENKALLEQIEKSIQDRFNNIQIIFKTLLMRNLTQML